MQIRYPLPSRILIRDNEPEDAEPIRTLVRDCLGCNADPAVFASWSDVTAAAQTNAYDLAIVEITSGLDPAAEVSDLMVADEHLQIVAFVRNPTAAPFEGEVPDGLLDVLGPRELNRRVLSRTLRLAQERNRTEHEIRRLRAIERSHQASAHLLDEVQHAVLAVSADGELVHANAAAAALAGCRVDELVGRPIQDVIEVDHRPRVLRALERNRNGHTCNNVECKFGLDGSGARWSDLDFAPWRAGDGSLGTVIVGRGMSDRGTVRARGGHEADAEEAALATVLDTVPVGILIADASGRPRLINRVARDLLGMNALLPLDRWSRADLFLRPDGSAASDEDLPMLKTLRDGLPRREVELHVAVPGQDPVPVLVSTDATRDGTGAIVEVTCTFTNITVRRHIARQLYQAQKMESVGTLAGGVAHDFNNMLCAIMGYCELILRNLDDEDPHKRLVKEIHKAGERASTLTRQLLSFSRQELSNVKILDLNGIVTDMQSLLRRLIGEDVELQTELAEGLSSVKADPGMIGQVVMNLAVNARDAMPEGGKLTISTSEYVAGNNGIELAPGKYVVVKVTDIGIGMDDRVRARLFEPFFTTKERGKGTGLGLSTVYRIVKQLGGHIRVESRPGEGSSFFIYLPAFDGTPVERVPPTFQDVVSTETRQTVLLVEDEPMVRTLVCEILEMGGYAVIEAANGEQALRACEERQAPIHALVTDVVMPQMSGRELAERVLGLRPEVKVLFVSGYTSDALLRYGVDQGEVAFLQKPFAPGELTHHLQDLLDRSPCEA